MISAFGVDHGEFSKSMESKFPIGFAPPGGHVQRPSPSPAASQAAVALKRGKKAAKGRGKMGLALTAGGIGAAAGGGYAAGQVSKLAQRMGTVAVQRKGQTVFKPKGKLRRLKAGAVNVTTKVGTAGPSPFTVAARAVTPLRHVLHA